MTAVVCLVVAGLVALAPQASAAGLAEYLGKPDRSFRHSLHSEKKLDGATGYVLRMTSQTWRGIPWEHWVAIVRPDEVEVPDVCLLVITGGMNGDKPPSADSSMSQFLIGVAKNTGTVVAAVEQVPNQPLFDGLYEDGLIAHTFDEYLNSGECDWPLLEPMVKSAVRAMDAVQLYAGKQWGQKVKRFVVTGASKRGWTTWLTGAVDRRVVAIAPAVFDVLNIGPQLEHQSKSYGGFSENISDYSSRDLPRRMDSERGQLLTKAVDPFEYRDRLTMPKLLLLGTNDAYWTVDSSNLYWPALPEPKYIHYEPNAGHGLGNGAYRALEAFYRNIVRSRRMPDLNWEHTDGQLTVMSDMPARSMRLWKARSDTRDFRDAHWRSQPLEGVRTCTVPVEAPNDGWTAQFVEVEYETKRGLPYTLSTTMIVLPEGYPGEEPAAE